jgi:hypothetical protein
MAEVSRLPRQREPVCDGAACLQADETSVMAPPALWRPRREDRAPLLTLALVPLLVALPALLGVMRADPALSVGYLGLGVHGHALPGYPYIDPNSGFTAQALGRLAATSWLRGVIPWWNSYSGVGMPLAGEYQPAAFFPVTLLLLLPDGVVWRHLALQLLAGWGCYALLRQLGLARLAALTGGLLFAQNGALAWFAHAPPDPAVFLPWALLGVERAAVKATLGAPRGWRLFALAMGLMLLAGFPETAYICGLLILVLAIGRWMQCPPDARLGMAWRVALGGCVGLALAAPQILAFVQFLPQAFLGGHSGDFVHAALVPEAAIPSLLAPYAFGPIFAFDDKWPILDLMWGNVGGYVDLVMLVLAAFGLASRRDWLGWLLLGWIALTLAKTFGVPLVADAWNLIPGIGQTAFFRYCQPSWEFAVIVLAASGIDAASKRSDARKAAILAAASALLLGAGCGLRYGIALWPHIAPFDLLRIWSLGSAAWALESSCIALGLLIFAPFAWRARALAGLLVFDATLMFALPTLSNRLHGEVDAPAINFLQQNLGLQRFYTLGPISPNYGAYFGVASINHNYLPVPRLWTDWVTAHLDRDADPITFTGNFNPASRQATPVDELRRNLAAYEEVGVKYVVAPAGQDPFAADRPAPGADQGDHLATLAQSANTPPQVYTDPLMSIYELPSPKPYFETFGGSCKLEPHSRSRIVVDCVGAATLMRREMIFPGWQASIDGHPTAIAARDELFQSIELPPGRSLVAFRYAPPYVTWAWLAMGLALAGLAFPVRMATNAGRPTRLASAPGRAGDEQ